MQTFILMYYDWFKVLHLAAVISWMAGLFYLPRLYVYHTTVDAQSVTSQTFKIMERKLLRIIMNPAMIVSWVSGLIMIYGNEVLLQEGWMHVKLTALALMTGFHHMLARWHKAFVRDENKQSEVFFRIANEVPTVLMLIILIMVFVRPF